MLAIAVSLLSALIAAWSLSESKTARSENHKLTISFRKTETLALLIDATNKGYQVLTEIHDCFEIAKCSGIENIPEIKNDIKDLFARKDMIFKKIKDLDSNKRKHMKTDFFDINEIEGMKSVSYAQLKAWENDIEYIKKIRDKFSNTTPPSVYEERGIRTL